MNKNRDWEQVTPIGTNELHLSASDQVQGVRGAFGNDVLKILSEQKKIKNPQDTQNVNQDFYDTFGGTSNGDLLINPNITISGNSVSISDLKIGKYQTYHALNNLRGGLGDNEAQKDLEKKEYNVLSAGGMLYDPVTQNFYAYKRPDDSQEAPGEIDLIGGCMNTTTGLDTDGNIDPSLYTKSRLEAKTGIPIDADRLKFLGVQHFNERGFFNIVYLYVLKEGESDGLNMNNVSALKLDEIEQYMNQDNPGGSGLTLALSDEMFTDKGFGPDVIKKIID